MIEHFVISNGYVSFTLFGNMEDIMQWFNWFAVILLATTKTREMRCAFDNLQEKCKDNCWPLPCESVDDDSFSDINKDLYETTTGKSLLYYKFVSIKEKIKSRLDICSSINETNEYFNEEYLNSFVLKCVPFIPLWTPVMNVKVNNGISVRQSNAVVESWFKTVKIDMLGVIAD
jgi:hypothetical protein